MLTLFSFLLRCAFLTGFNIPLSLTFRSETYSSTDASDHAGVSAFADPGEEHSPATGLPPMQAEYDGPGGILTDPNANKSHARRGSNGGIATQHGREKTSDDRVGDADKLAGRQGGGRLEDEDIPKSEWGRTLDTAVSIPEGPEERADEHEANASLEHALERGMTGDDSDGAMVLVASKGGVDMTALNASADSTEL